MAGMKDVSIEIDEALEQAIEAAMTTGMTRKDSVSYLRLRLREIVAEPAA